MGPRGRQHGAIGPERARGRQKGSEGGERLSKSTEGRAVLALSQVTAALLAHDALAALLPPGVASAVRDPGEPIEVHPDEAPFVARAVETRQREFASGRACARRAMAELGLPPHPIPSGPRREPLWPAGVVGSVTHTSGFCAAAVSRRAEYAGLGIDAERDGPLAEGIAARVCLDEELGRAGALGLDPGTLAHVVFSAKEAVYKCQFPESGTFLGFHDVRLELEAESLRAVLEVPAGPYARGHVFYGRWRRAGGLILTAVWHPARS
jgi:4'-phosphopantetheinyl transferase EntD